MLPSEIGERAEAAVLAALVAAGKRVLLPFGEQHRFDLCYEEAGQLVKVQCKTGVLRRGAIVVRTHSVGRKSVRDYRDDVDFFGIYCHATRAVYLVPISDLPPRAAHLRVEPSRNSQRIGVRLAENYLLGPDNPPPVLSPHRLLPPPKDPDQLILTDIDIGGRVGDMKSELPQLPVACCSPLAAPRLSDDAAEATATIFKALSDPHRVRIMNLLANAGAPVCVCEITPALGLSQPTTSFHLKKLQNAGLITREQRGTWAYYEIDRSALETLTGVLDLRKEASV